MILTRGVKFHLEQFLTVKSLIDLIYIYICIPIKSYNIFYKLHYTPYRNTLQYKLHYTTYRNDSTILLQRCPEEQKTMSTPRPLNEDIYKKSLNLKILNLKIL